MSSLFSKDDEKVGSKDQKPTTDPGSPNDSKPETIGSKIVLYQPSILAQQGEGSGKVAEHEEPKDSTPTSDKNEPGTSGTSKGKDEIIPETDASQPATSEQSSSGKKKPVARRSRTILGLPVALKRTSIRLKNNRNATANVTEQVDSARRNPKKRRVALFLDVDHTDK